MKSYAGLLIKGYPHVAQAYGLCGQPGFGDLAGATRALGIGYYAFQPVSDGFCGSYPTISSSNPRLWDAGRYDNGNGPGRAILDTINANPDCLGNLTYVQTSDPLIPSFPATYCSGTC